MPSFDNLRLIAWATLAYLLFMNYEAWQKDYAPPPAAQVAAQAAAPVADTFASAVPTAAAPAPAPVATTAPAAAGVPAPATAAAPVAAAPAVPAQDVHIKTDVLDLTLSTRGGDLVQLDLPEYPLHKDNPAVKVRLFENSDPNTRYVLQGGLTTGAAAHGGSEPNHTAIYTAAQTSYTLPEGAAELRVPLTWTDGQGLTVMRTYVFRRGQYAVDVETSVQNAGSATVSLTPYAQLLRRAAPVKSSMFNPETYAYRGPAVYDGTKYTKLKVDDAEMQKFTQQITGGWFAAMQHHFVAAIVPPGAEAWNYALKVNGEDALMQVVGPAKAVAPGGTAQLSQKLYMGPKLHDQLVATAPELERTVDYGKYLTPIAAPLFWILRHVYNLVGNWGIAIILVTLLIKLVFYKLAETSGRSMARMRHIAPRMKAMQEQFKDNKDELGRRMMELYKTEKVNPVAGCLPMLVQIPFFIAFYWVLMESVEMRQAPFFGYLNDLSSRDPYFILPIIMAIAMYGQFKLNPPPADPIQAKVFAFMPVVMAGTMAFFPSGLVLYWITNTGLSILQQWHINKLVEAEAAARKT